MLWCTPCDSGHVLLCHCSKRQRRRKLPCLQPCKHTAGGGVCRRRLYTDPGRDGAALQCPLSMAHLQVGIHAKGCVCLQDACISIASGAS